MSPILVQLRSTRLKLPFYSQSSNAKSYIFVILSLYACGSCLLCPVSLVKNKYANCVIKARKRTLCFATISARINEIIIRERELLSEKKKQH